MLRALRRLLREEWGQAMRRGVFVGLGMAIAAGGMAIAYNANTGGTTTTTSTTTTTTPPSGYANIWMDPAATSNGGSCQRSGTPAVYDPLRDCVSVAAACAVAQGGDTVRVDGGSYGSQTACVKGGSQYVTYYLDPSATFSSVNFNSTGSYYQKFVGGTITTPFFANSITPAFIWFENNNMNVSAAGQYGSIMQLYNGHDLTFIGPGVFDGTTNPLNDIIWFFNVYNLRFDDFIFRNMTPGNETHTETFRFQAQTQSSAPHDVTIENSLFYNNTDSTGTLYFTADNSCSGTGCPYNFTFRNNIFFPSSCCGKTFWANSPNMTTCAGFHFLYNTFLDYSSIQPTGSIQGGWNCSVGAGTEFIGNTGVNWGCISGAVVAFNVRQWDSNPNCSATDTYVNGPRSYSNLGLTGTTSNPPQAILSGTSPARNNGDPSNFPASDKYGNPRPLPAGDNQNVDAGASEVN